MKDGQNMEWGTPNLQQANGHHTPGLLYYLDRLDGKIDMILYRMGEGTEVHRRLTAESEQHRADIKELRSQIASVAKPNSPSRLRIIIDEMKTVMSLREWMLVTMIVVGSLVGLQIPEEIKAAAIDAIAKTAGGG